MNNSYFKLQYAISTLLLSIGAGTNLLGYSYFKEGIIVIMKKQGHIKSFIKDIYEEIAIQNNSSVSRVEKAIRTVIKSIWDSDRLYILNEFFDVKDVFTQQDRPSNNQLMLVIANRLLQDYSFTADGKCIER